MQLALSSCSQLTSPSLSLLHCRALNQSPFDVLLLKLTDLMSASLYSNDVAARRNAAATLELVQRSVARQSLTRPLAVLEPLEHVWRVLDRAAIHQLAQQIDTSVRGESVRCSVPPAFLYQPLAPNSTSGCSCPPPPSSAQPATAGLPLLHSLPADLTFPVMVKSVAACGTSESHRMYVLQRAEDFAALPSSLPSAHSPEQHDCASSSGPTWFVQQFINHGGVVYKVYVLDEEVHVLPKVRQKEKQQQSSASVSRRAAMLTTSLSLFQPLCLLLHVFLQSSLPDLDSSSPSYWLNSQEMQLQPLLPPDQSSSNAVTRPLLIPPPSSPPSTVPPAIKQAASKCAAQLRQLLQLRLFGFDLILQTPHAADSATSAASAPSAPSSFLPPAPTDTAPFPPAPRCFLIDVNYFPSYKSVDDLREKLLRFCAKHRPTATRSAEATPPSSSAS